MARKNSSELVSLFNLVSLFEDTNIHTKELNTLSGSWIVHTRLS